MKVKLTLLVNFILTLTISRVFECGKCHDCKVKEKCTKAKEQRKIQINYALNEMQDKVDENLGTEEENINVKTELLLIGIAYNIRKYHNKKKEMSIF